MSTPRDVRLSPQELALKQATKAAVQAAGGQTFVASEVNRAQSRISDYCSPNTSEFMPLDIAVTVEALGAGSPGYPHITRALARAAGISTGAPVGNPPQGMNDLGDWMASVSKDFGDLVAELADEDLAAACTSLSPRSREDIKREASQLRDRLGQLCRAIDTG